MPNILLTNKYSNRVLEEVRKIVPEGFNFDTLEKLTKKELIQKAAGSDYFLASGRLYIDKEVIESAPKLKMIQRTGVGTDTIDILCLKQKGIPVYVNPGINSSSVAEHAVLLMLALLRKLVMVDTSVKSGKWNKNDIGFECSSLNGKVIGLIGIGNIGKKVAQIVRSFGVTVLYYNPYKLSNKIENELNVQFCDFKKMISEVDILSLHCPLTPETKGIIGTDELKLMKKSAVLINTARGPLVDQDALIKALNQGMIKGAGLDVYKKEPPKSDSPLLKLDNVILTPHIAGLTMETFCKMITNAFENIKLFEMGQLGLIENKKIK